MSTLIPASRSNGLAQLKTIKATRAQYRAEVTVFRHSLETAVMTELDRQDSQAIADVMTTATEEELRFLDYGLALSGNSVAKTELVARKVNLMSNINNQRIARRFGR
ncbi:hypothetical protein [Acidithrix sp. C25]|uniref:hypothetical protein n=1 Tax=Acidithrix sp. C25 TaxID=1671482 RepID=UPI00191BBC58|nr:hypothetical protein [Acidithrix sp. C25]